MTRLDTDVTFGVMHGRFRPVFSTMPKVNQEKPTSGSLGSAVLCSFRLSLNLSGIHPRVITETTLRSTVGRKYWSVHTLTPKSNRVTGRKVYGVVYDSPYL